MGIVQNGDSSQETKPDYHRMKTMVKRSIEQNLRTKNFEARSGRFETSAVVKNQRVNSVARGMGSLRLALDSRLRTRKGPQPAYVQTPFCPVAHAGGEG